jgi:predicted DNA-binding protein
MGHSLQVREEFAKMRVLDGATLEKCVEHLGVSKTTAQRWATEPWFAEMEQTLRLARDEGIREAARLEVQRTRAEVMQQESAWEGQRKVFIGRLRNIVEDTVTALEQVSREISELARFEDMRDFKLAVESHAKLVETSRKLLMVEHEEKLAVASAHAAATQRLTPDEIASLSPEQLQVLIREGMDSLKEAKGTVIDA